MSGYREAAAGARLDHSRDLWPLRNAYEKRWCNGIDVLSLLCAGLILGTTLGATNWPILTAALLISNYFIVRGLSERWANLPPDVLARADHVGLLRKRFERRHDFVDRILLAELHHTRDLLRQLPHRCDCSDYE